MKDFKQLTANLYPILSCSYMQNCTASKGRSRNRKDPYPCNTEDERSRQMHSSLIQKLIKKYRTCSIVNWIYSLMNLQNSGASHTAKRPLNPSFATIQRTASGVEANCAVCILCLTT